jgi:hypothetical protein
VKRFGRVRIIGADHDERLIAASAFALADYFFYFLNTSIDVTHGPPSCKRLAKAPVGLPKQMERYA